MQMLRAGNTSLEAVLITHEHNDHVAGLDDVRPFNFIQKREMPVYALPRVTKVLRSRFPYAFDDDPYPGSPRIALHPIKAGIQFSIGDIPVLPIAVQHGEMPILGYQIGPIAYITDAKLLAGETVDMLRGIPILVLNALHHRPHHAHLNLEEALDMIARIRPANAYLTHISHHMGRHEEVCKTLPEGVSLAWDGLIVAA